MQCKSLCYTFNSHGLKPCLLGSDCTTSWRRRGDKGGREGGGGGRRREGGGGGRREGGGRISLDVSAIFTCLNQTLSPKKAAVLMFMNTFVGVRHRV